MNDSFFYTFSTMPQVLAGAIALLGVFVLFRLRQIEDKMFGLGSAVLDEFDRSESKATATVNEANKWLISRIDKAISKRSLSELEANLIETVEILKSESFQRHVKRGFGELKEGRTNLLKNARRVLVLTVLSTFLTALAIPFEESLRHVPDILVYGAGFLLFGLSLLLTGKLVYDAMDHQK